MIQQIEEKTTSDVLVCFIHINEVAELCGSKPATLLSDKYKNNLWITKIKIFEVNQQTNIHIDKEQQWYYCDFELITNKWRCIDAHKSIQVYLGCKE